MCDLLEARKRAHLSWSGSAKYTVSATVVTQAPGGYAYAMSLWGIWPGESKRYFGRRPPK